jgi:hypothetical protein
MKQKRSTGEGISSPPAQRPQVPRCLRQWELEGGQDAASIAQNANTGQTGNAVDLADLMGLVGLASFGLSQLISVGWHTKETCQVGYFPEYGSTVRLRDSFRSGGCHRVVIFDGTA